MISILHCGEIKFRSAGFGDGCNQDTRDLIKVYLPISYQSYWNVFLRASEGGGCGSYRFASILVFSSVMAYNNKKVGAIYGCHITFMFKTVP